MYHCHIHFYLVGQGHEIFEIIRGMSPLENFTHEFSQDDKAEAAKAAEADVILADLRAADVKETVCMLTEKKREQAELILLAEQDQFALLTEYLPKIGNIWTLPMTDEEVRFRFLRWQQAYRLGMDCWQASHYLDATINNTPELIWYKNKDGIHEKVNDSFCRTVNKTREQVEGQGHAYIWDVESDDPACIESENEVMRTEQTCVSEEIIETGDGQRRLTVYKSPLYNIDGSVTGTVGIGIDVTQEYDYKQELIQKNRTMEKIFMAMDCGVLCHTVDGSRVISINQAALNILGYESQEEMMLNGFDMVADTVMEEDKPKIRNAIEGLKEEGDSTSAEYRVQHKDGEVLYIVGNAKLLREDGELFYQRFLLDCTAQKHQEQETEQHHTDLIQALGIDYKLICYFDLVTGKGISIRADSDMEAVFASGLDGELVLEEGMKRYIQELVYEEDREMLSQSSTRERLEDELEHGKVFYVNYRAMEDGEITYYQMKVVRTGAWGTAKGIVVGFRSTDAEIRKEMEQKCFLEDALMQANRANKAKSVFLSNMSHDIRTPMNAIVGFTALAITHIDNREQVEEYLKKIMTSGNHLLSLINDVLDMSRIESGRMYLEEKPCSLPEILHGLRNILQADIRAKQLELYIDTVDILDEEIYCDKLRLNQVLLNLMSNAVKYTGAGGAISLRIIEKPGAPDGTASYEFRIKDTGIGMSEEFVTHIFEPFERERNSTISKIQGTGLGMAITKNIVDMMNGTIDVKSEQGVGTEITVALNFRLHCAKKEPQDIPEFKNCRALVVDDDFNTCDSVTYMLQQFGMRAEWTMSGKEAVLRTRQAAAREDNYSVYVVDWLLPDMNGVEVTRRIRKEMGDEVPVIILTAYDWTDIEDEAREAGVTAFCSKPLFMSELRDCLYSIVSEDSEENAQEERAAEGFPTGRILLTEDNELNQEIAVAILTEAGFTVDVADNGQIAVDMLRESEPGYYQLVLMDIQMPVMDGYTAAKEIRGLKNKQLASIPILAMTANAFEEDKKRALAGGMNGHLAKPIDVEILFETLKKVLG